MVDDKGGTSTLSEGHGKKALGVFIAVAHTDLSRFGRGEPNC